MLDGDRRRTDRLQNLGVCCVDERILLPGEMEFGGQFAAEIPLGELDMVEEPVNQRPPIEKLLPQRLDINI